MRDDMKDQQSERPESGFGEGEIGELLRRSGPRPDVPAAELHRIKSSARLEWLALVSSRQKRRRALRLLVPAAVTAIVLLTIWIRGSGDAVSVTPTVAVVELVRGTAWLEEPTGSAPGLESELAAGRSLARGIDLVTEEDPDAAVNVASIRLTGGQSVRVGSGTRLTLIDSSKIELRAGLVYVDSPGPETGRSKLAIGTPHGTVVDIGTQFLVSVTGGAEQAVTVRVRTGKVQLRGRQSTHTATAGEEIRLRRDSFSRGSIETTGAAWDWILSAAPAFDLEGASLAEFLDWAARETGWSLRWADPTLAEEAAGIEMHGAIDRLRPDEAVEAVLPGAGLSHRLEGDELIVSRSPGDPDDD